MLPQIYFKYFQKEKRVKKWSYATSNSESRSAPLMSRKCVQHDIGNVLVGKPLKGGRRREGGRGGRADIHRHVDYNRFFSLSGNSFWVGEIFFYKPVWWASQISAHYFPNYYYFFVSWPWNYEYLSNIFKIPMKM